MATKTHSKKAHAATKRTHAKIKDQAPGLDFDALLAAMGPEVDSDLSADDTSDPFAGTGELVDENA